MAPDALRMLAWQLRRDPNPDAIEDAACALEAVAIERERRASSRARQPSAAPASGTMPRSSSPWPSEEEIENQATMFARIRNAT